MSEISKEDVKEVKDTDIKKSNAANARKRKSKSKGKPKKSNPKGQNDITWYKADPQMLQDSCTIPFYNPTGMGIKNVLQRDFTLPGIMTFDVCHGLGITGNSMSPANVAARKVYSFVRYQNNKTAPYEAVDLQLYLCGVSEPVTYHAWMTRLYGILMTWSQQNRYIPKAIFESMNVDFEDLSAHIPDFRMYINVYANQLSAMAVPSTMSYFLRHAWLYSNVYMDSDTPQASMYVFNPHTFLKFEATTDKKGGKLVPITERPLSSLPKLKFEDIKRMGDELLLPILLDEEMNIMSGDILKAFGDQLYTCGTIKEDYTLTPCYNAEVLSQIHNATICGDPIMSSLEIKQDSGLLEYNPLFTKEMLSDTTAYWSKDRILDTRDGKTSPDDVMIATRLMNIMKKHPTMENTFVFDSVGSEFISSARIWYFDVSTDAYILASREFEYAEDINLSDNPEFDYISIYMDILTGLLTAEQFADHPLFIINFHRTTEYGDKQTDVIVGDITEHTTVNSYMLRKMHEVALYSEFALPAMGSWESTKKA